MEIKKETPIKLLDKGEVELIDWLGTDLTVINSARVSFGKRKKFLDGEDKKLVKYLKNNKHYSPFRHLIVQLRIKAPEFVLRQLYKHVVGIETTSSYSTKDHAWNEISQRYTPVSEFYFPFKWRLQSENNKQASNGILDDSDQVESHLIYNNVMKTLNNGYNELLKLGVAKEQARILLPLSAYTEVWWTASWQALANFIELRDDEHAQMEIREYAIIIKKILKTIYPETFKAWFD